MRAIQGGAQRSAPARAADPGGGGLGGGGLGGGGGGGEAVRAQVRHGGRRCAAARAAVEQVEDSMEARVVDRSESFDAIEVGEAGGDVGEDRNLVAAEFVYVSSAMAALLNEIFDAYDCPVVTPLHCPIVDAEHREELQAVPIHSRGH